MRHVASSSSKQQPANQYVVGKPSNYKQQDLCAHSHKTHRRGQQMNTKRRKDRRKPCCRVWFLLSNRRTCNSFVCLWHNGGTEYQPRRKQKKKKKKLQFIIIRANEFLDRFQTGIIGDAPGLSLAWKMVVIWLDEGQWGPPPRPEQTGAEEPRAGGINEQAVLKGTGSCNADEWSLQSRDERREQKGGGGEGGGGGERRVQRSGHRGSSGEKKRL